MVSRFLDSQVVDLESSSRGSSERDFNNFKVWSQTAHVHGK